MTSVAANHGSAELSELFLDLRRARMMGSETAMLGREAEGDGHLEVGERLHLPVEPFESIRAKTIRPGQPCSQVFHAKALHPDDGVVKAVILIMEPLAEPHLRRVFGKF